MRNQSAPYHDEAKKLVSSHLASGYQLTELYPYTTIDGAPVYWRLRLEKEGCNKIIRPMSHNDAGNFVIKEPDFTDKKPLYRLQEMGLADTSKIVHVTEGEKCADTLAKLGLLASTSGSSSSANGTDWTPLAGRTVKIWPDANTAGKKYGLDVGKILSDLGSSVSYIQIDNLELPDGGDCVDWMESNPNYTKTDVEALDTILYENYLSLPAQEPANTHPCFIANKNGVYYQKDKIDSTWLCSWLIVKAFTRDSDGVNWGRVLVFTDADQIEHQWTMPMELLGGQGEELMKELFRQGLRIAAGTAAKKLLIEYITTSDPDMRARCVLRTGWHENCFVLPNKIIGETDELVIFQSDTIIANQYKSANSLKEWQRHIGQNCIGNSRLIFAISVALAPPLLKLLEIENGGFHFRGESSTGKTTALTVAGSVWGNRNYVQNWRATDNGLESIAALHNDTLLILDELSQIDPKHAGGVAYMLANGQGKARASRSGAIKPRYNWRLLFLSSGEISLSSHMIEAGKRAKAGQEVRMIDIPADAGAGFGLYENIHAESDPAQFSEMLKGNCSKYYGVAGQAFIEKLITVDVNRIRTFVVAAQEKLATIVPTGLHGQVKRVLSRFALVIAAGELASEQGVTGWETGVVINAVAKCALAWLKSRGSTGSTEKKEILESICHFFQENEVRFDVFSDSALYEKRNRPHKCAGFTDGASGDFYVYPKTFTDEICKGLGEANEIAKLLLEAGLLHGDPKNNKPYSSIWVPTLGKTIKAYVFSSNVIGNDKQN